MGAHRINGRVELGPSENSCVMTQAEQPPIPKLLDMRWVCGLCLAVLEAPLKVIWEWCRDTAGEGKGYWHPQDVREPICHGRAMLVAGRPKLDIYGSGLMVDPVYNLRCPKIEPV